ncbi:MAG: nicotinamide mononucleotide transporter [Ruminococcaceae bacterium]|nr:nicotinamide mononucleotide transporter [Oscillospiraceae bacterium]
MNIFAAFRSLRRHERILWIVSVIVVTASFLLVPERDYMTLAASLIGVTALIFVAKGYVIGQVLTVVFAVFYGIISYYCRYYGEMITYLCMSSPIAILSVISWYRHPYRDSDEVEVNRVTRRQVVLMWVMAIAVTVLFYFILKALGNASLLVSTVSVTTSFLASWLTFLRSPYYALAYAANDVVLIILWIIASVADISCLPMIFCFVMFLLNDLYGFINWRQMRKRQMEESAK